MLGFLDPLPPANHTSSYPGLFRQITPLITLANHSVIPLPAWGSLSMDPPFSPFYPPVYPEGWCAVDLQTASVHERAWVVGEGLEGEVLNVELNITWGLPSYVRPLPIPLLPGPLTLRSTTDSRALPTRPRFDPPRPAPTARQTALPPRACTGPTSSRTNSPSRPRPPPPPLALSHSRPAQPPRPPRQPSAKPPPWPPCQPPSPPGRPPPARARPTASGGTSRSKLPFWPSACSGRVGPGRS